MQTTLTIMRPGEPDELRVFDLAEEPGYDKLRTILTPLLDGGELEHVTVLHDGQRADMFVTKDLPFNCRATVIYRNNWLTHHPDADPNDLPPILGPAVLFSRQVWF